MVKRETERDKFLKALRKKYSVEKIFEFLKDLKNSKVLLIGETILDEYCFVQVMGKSPKGIHIATKFINQERYAGGVLACANHLAGFCNKVDLVTALGERGSWESFIRHNLKPNINPKFFYLSKAPTIIKRRFVDSNYFNKLFEVYVFDDSLTIGLEDHIVKYLLANFNSYDLILVVDYGHGLLTPKLIDIICGLPCFLAVNAQSNTASIGYNPITKYPKANFFCLGEPEIHLAFQDKHADIHELTKLLARQVSLPGAVAVTRGPMGSIIYDAGKEQFHHTPALSEKVVDTIGAGDAFLSLTSVCMAKGFPVDLTGFIGNAAGSLAIEVLGNKTPIKSAFLFKFIGALFDGKGGK